MTLNPSVCLRKVFANGEKENGHNCHKASSEEILTNRVQNFVKYNLRCSEKILTLDVAGIKN